MTLRFLRLHGLQARLVLVLLLLVALPVAGIALYDRFFTDNALVPHVVQRLVREVHLQARHVVSILDTARADIFLLANLRSARMLRSLLDDGGGADPAQVAIWRGEVAQDVAVIAAANPGYTQVEYLDRDGRELVRIDRTGSGATIAADATLRDRGGLSYIRETMALGPGEIYVSALDAEPVRGDGNMALTPVVRYAMRLPDGSGMIAISLHAQYVLGDLLAYAGPHDNWSVVDQSGEYLMYSDEYLGPAASGPPSEPLQLQSVHPAAADVLEGGAGVSETETNMLVYNTIHPMPSQPERFWVIIHDTPKSVLFADITSFHTAVGVLLLGTLLTAIALALFASERIVTPILQLKRRVEQFGQDGVVPPAPDRPGQDEIGALTRAFDDMAHELDKKRQLQRRLIERLITAQEEERKLVAYDLHDGLIQQMVGARFHLTTFRQKCTEDGEATASLERGCEALSEAIAEGRRIIEGLRPAVLDDLGLASALEDTARTMSQAAGWQLDYASDHLSVEPDKTVSVTLFRIAQEALNNARKHAQATAVSVRLTNSHGLKLVIHDNGRGFNPAALAERGRGLGITTMRERAALLDGACTIHSAPGEGTTVEAWVPIHIEEKSP
ncbi:MAG: HAMP domain-containing protein [Anaerolineae bacterium]|nr:HAMP domain-containing protein [Anaerolineae bacterium]